MKIAIVEDEKIHLDYLVSILEDVAKEKNMVLSIQAFESAETFLFAFEDENFDGILLDILLDEMNGFSLAEVIRRDNPYLPLAFITGEKDYVFDGYQVDAFAYILKPITPKSVRALLDKLQEKVLDLDSPIAIKNKEGLENLYQRDIDVVESDDHITRVFTDERVLVSNYKMKEWKGLVKANDFFSPHRSYLINLGRIRKIEKKNVTMSNEMVVPIARGKWQALMQAYMNYRRKGF